MEVRYLACPTSMFGSEAELSNPAFDHGARKLEPTRWPDDHPTDYRFGYNAVRHRALARTESAMEEGPCQP